MERVERLLNNFRYYCLSNDYCSSVLKPISFHSPFVNTYVFYYQQERAGVKMVMIQDGPQNTGADKPLRITGDPYKVQVNLRLYFIKKGLGGVQNEQNMYE